MAGTILGPSVWGLCRAPRKRLWFEHQPVRQRTCGLHDGEARRTVSRLRRRAGGGVRGEGWAVIRETWYFYEVTSKPGTIPATVKDCGQLQRAAC